jgi:hypothetical protein
MERLHRTLKPGPGGALDYVVQGRAVGIGGNPVLLGLAKGRSRAALRSFKAPNAVPPSLVTDDDRSQSLLVPLPKETRGSVCA